jgi:hypothetical protein
VLTYAGAKWKKALIFQQIGNLGGFVTVVENSNNCCRKLEQLYLYLGSDREADFF